MIEDTCLGIFTLLGIVGITALAVLLILLPAISSKKNVHNG